MKNIKLLSISALLVIALGVFAFNIVIDNPVVTQDIPMSVITDGMIEEPEHNEVVTARVSPQPQEKAPEQNHDKITRTTPTTVKQDTKPTVIKPEHPKVCPPGSYDIGMSKTNEPLCRLEPTGCPYGNSIPLEYCVKE